jgi:hypothetical protein
MSKLSKNKSPALHFVLSLVILWVLAYVCFAFVLAELNPFKWEQSIRGGYVFAMVSILTLSFPISQIIKLELE